MDLAPPRGTRDFYPEELRLRSWLFAHFREVAGLFGFEEYDAPVVESVELYTRKAGEEIVDQLYAFKDKGGRDLALRPEMTPSLARLVLSKGRALPMPVKWFSIPQCWRYERMTRGRRREHYQWNMDIFGIEDVSAEAELLSAITTFFGRVGLSATDVGIKVSNRKLLTAVMESLGVPSEHFAAVCVLVDKLEKMPREAIEEDLAKLGLEGERVERILEVLSLRSIDDVAKVLGDEGDGIDELRRLFDLADSYGYADWLVFDPSVVRGLAYYTGTVFEAFDRGATLRAICGGGRYDRLLSTFGGTDLPACGFGFGDVVIVDLLTDRELLPTFTQGVDDLVLPFDLDLRAPAVQIATQLRRAGRTVDLVLEKKRAKWAFQRADRIGAKRVILVAPDEWQRGMVRVKDLATGVESDVLPADL